MKSSPGSKRSRPTSCHSRRGPLLRHCFRSTRNNLIAFLCWVELHRCNFSKAGVRLTTPTPVASQLLKQAVTLLRRREHQYRVFWGQWQQITCWRAQVVTQQIVCQRTRKTGCAPLQVCIATIDSKTSTTAGICGRSCKVTRGT
jgi:hypothetical protein